MIGCRTVVVMCLLALALPLQHRLAEATVGDSTKEKKNQQETCHDQCKETPANNPYARNYPCPLVNQLYYYTTCDCVSQVPNNGVGTGLSPADKQAMLDFIASLEVQLEAMDGNINDTSIVEVCLSMQVFFDAHVSIKNMFSFLSINDSSGVFFGTIQDFVSLHIVLQFEVVGPVLEVGSDGHCALDKAIEEAAASSGNQQIIDECHNVSMHIVSLLKHVEFNVTEQLSFIYQIIIKECSVETISFLSAHCHIAGFGSFISIFNMCEVNFRIQRMHVYMSGSSSSDCDFLADLQATFSATCYSGSPNSSQCTTLNNLIDKVTVVISSSVDIEFRMRGCANEIFEMCKAAPWICGIRMGRCGCSLYDIMYTSAFCHNEGCCDWNSSPPELPECSCESSGSGSGETDITVSGESPTPPGCDGTGPCESGESPTPPASGESPTPPASGDSPTPPASGESPTPPASGESPTPPASGESPTPPASPEVTTPEGPVEESSVPPMSTASVPATTTTAPMSHCESRQRIIIVQTSCNCSSLYLSIVKVTNTWSFTQKQSVAPVINQIQKILYDKTMSAAQKIAAIFNQLNGYNPSNSSWKTQFFAITIYEADMVTVWGTLGDFFTCGSSCTCSGSG